VLALAHRQIRTICLNVLNHHSTVQYVIARKIYPALNVIKSQEVTDGIQEDTKIQEIRRLTSTTTGR